MVNHFREVDQLYGLEGSKGSSQETMMTSLSVAAVVGELISVQVGPFSRAAASEFAMFKIDSDFAMDIVSHETNTPFCI